MGVALPLGLALLCLLGLALALAGQLAPARVWTVAGLLTALQARTFGRAFARGREAIERGAGLLRAPLAFEPGLLLLLGFGTALLSLLWALTPEIQFDALNYHLAVPKAYLEAGRLVNIPLFLHSYLVRLVDMLYLLSLALHGPMVAKLLVFAMGVVTASGMYTLGREIFDERTGLWAAVFFYATPLVVWSTATTYTDLALAMFFQASLLSLLRWRATRQPGWLWAAALLAGAAIGTKSNMVYAYPVFVLLLARDLLRRRGGGRQVAGWLLVAGVVAAPMSVITWAFTGVWWRSG